MPAQISPRHSVETLSFQKVSQRLVKSLDGLILFFNPPEGHEKQLFAVRGGLDQMLKKSRQIFHIRLQLPEPFPVVANLGWW